ncbi:MAG: DUF6285 domain-containing protein [Actinomycetota bacterium]|nr:DUF6285 domain-containing protein [Actinomycetota bacterium]
MQDRPSSAELLEALAELLEDEVLPSVEGPLRYRTLVGLNLTRIVEREIRLSPAQLSGERARLVALLGEQPVPGPVSDQVFDLNARLEARLRSQGAVDDPAFTADLLEALEATAREKLAVCRPGYDDYDPATEVG